MTTEESPSQHSALRDHPPPEIDASIARLYYQAACAEGQVLHLKETIARATRPTVHVSGKITEAAEQAAVELPAVQKRLETFYTLARPYEDEFTRRGGWTRYYLITDGHLHYDVSGTRCSRTPNSDHYWVTDLSGKTEAEAIAIAGERICTVCFPSAPVGALTRPSRLYTPTERERIEARTQREKVREDKAAKVKAAAILDVDGCPLLDRTGHVLSTERAAMVEYRDIAADLVYYGDKEAHDRNRGVNQSPEEHEASRVQMLADYTRAEQRIAAALAAKHGVSIEQEREAHAKPVSVRVRKNAKAAKEFRTQHAGLFADSEEN